ncbi:MAG: hypothetical protein MI924_01860, partial [Chloroflexales bacterium]|nr:hypothetical protein [Chloroflexales bacterium]
MLRYQAIEGGEMLRDRSVRLLVLTIALVFVRPFITDLLAPAYETVFLWVFYLATFTFIGLD